MKKLVLALLAVSAAGILVVQPGWQDEPLLRLSTEGDAAEMALDAPPAAPETAPEPTTVTTSLDSIPAPAAPAGPQAPVTAAPTTPDRRLDEDGQYLETLDSTTTTTASATTTTAPATTTTGPALQPTTTTTYLRQVAPACAVMVDYVGGDRWDGLVTSNQPRATWIKVYVGAGAYSEVFNVLLDDSGTGLFRFEHVSQNQNWYVGVYFGSQVGPGYETCQASHTA